jgi:hypothetical protein
MKLGDISPLAGMLTGQGLTGKLMAKGFGGILPAAIARNAQKDREREEEEAAEIAAAEAAEGRSTQGMKKGGKVSSASSRADGCAQRGKTKGRMV